MTPQDEQDEQDAAGNETGRVRPHERSKEMNPYQARYVSHQIVTARRFTSEAELGILATFGEAKVGDWLVRENLDTFCVVSPQVFAEQFEPAHGVVGHYHDATGHEDTLCQCPSPGTYAPQWPEGSEEEQQP